MTMPIAPTTILEVRSAASQGAATAAKPSATLPDVDFAATLATVEKQAPAPAAPLVHGKGGQSGTLSDLQQFEAFVLRTFVESMLPKENSSFFGTGTAGDIWRSMLAERVGEEIAAGGGIGIADLLAADETLSSGAGEAAETLGSAEDARRSAAFSVAGKP